jgi:hypothetical protein
MGVICLHSTDREPEAYARRALQELKIAANGARGDEGESESRFRLGNFFHVFP